MENNNELNLNELENAAGGTGGSKRPLPPKAGCFVYWIQRGDTLSKLANRYNTTVAAIKAVNPTIHNANDITADYYIYIPESRGIA